MSDKIESNSINPPSHIYPEQKTSDNARSVPSTNDEALKEIWSVVQSRFRDYLHEIDEKS